MDITLQTLSEQIDSIKQMTLIGVKEVLNLDEACLFCDISKGQMYRLTSQKQIPHCKKGQKLYFEKAALTEWLTDERVQTVQDINRRAATYVTTHK